MRVRTAVAILIAVNVLWAAAFFGYVQRSTTPLVKQLKDAPTPEAKATSAPSTNVVNAATAPLSNAVTAGLTSPSSPRLVKSLPSADKKFGWRDVTNDTYLDYIASLRAVGCPEKQIRNIVVADVSELFDQRRLEYAIKSDPQWWKAETFMGVLPMQGGVANASFDEQRRDVLNKLLGEDWSDTIKLPSLNGAAVNLTGPVLGALPAETWNAVQEICARSMDRHQAYQMARINEGGPMDNTELAKLRDQTRTDLKKVLTTEQLEEFLLRYSFNSSKLRQDMRGIDLTPDEFRKIFRATDSLEHQMQVDYGSTETLSQKQRAELEALRDRAVKETLSAEHYAQYLASKDPLFKQAQMMAMQYGMNTKAIQALYDMQKSLDTKRAQLSQNTTLTPEQKAQAFQSLGVEHQQMLQQILADARYRQGN